MTNIPYFPDAEVPLPERMTPEQFVEWVASWVLDGDTYQPDPDEPGYDYELENDEVYENYAAIVTEARRLAGKETA